MSQQGSPIYEHHDGWWVTPCGGAEYVPVPTLVFGRVTWDRESKTWDAEVLQYRVGGKAAVPFVPFRDGFRTSGEAMSWVEGVWRPALAKAPLN